jgi:hypothetical protein
VLERAIGNTDTQDSPRPGLGGSHYLPLYSILCTFPRGSPCDAPLRNSSISDGLSVSCECIREHPPSIAPTSTVFLCFLSNSIAAMMNLCSNSEEQSDPKLIEYRQVADRVQEVGRCDRQEIGKLSGSRPTLNGNGNGYFTSPIPSNDGKLSARARFAWPEQYLGSIALEVNTSRSGSAHPRDKNSIDQAPAPLVTPKR